MVQVDLYLFGRRTTDHWLQSCLSSDCGIFDVGIQDRRTLAIAGERLRG